MLLLLSFGLERDEAVPLAALLAAPSVILWTFAGLETPLLASIVMAMAAVYMQVGTGMREDSAALGVLGGLAVLTRYDAVLFAGPCAARSAGRAEPVIAKARMTAMALAVCRRPVVPLRMAALRMRCCRRRSTSRLQRRRWISLP